MASHGNHTSELFTQEPWRNGPPAASVLYICYYDVIEPLVQSQVIPYLSGLSKRGFQIHLLTFEQAFLPAARRQEIAADLAGARVRWRHLRYHHRPSLAATLYDIVVGTLVGMAICKKHDIRIVHARSHVAAAMAMLIKRLMGCHFLFDLRGLLADEYVESGNWRPRSIKYRLTKRMERAFLRQADAVVMLTNRIKEELFSARPEASGGPELELIPCCVDTARFEVSEESRAAYREKRGWTGRIVLTYVGKLGTWYMTREMARFFAIAQESDPRFYFQVITQSGPDEMERHLKLEGVSAANYELRFVAPSELPVPLAASDAGISFVSPTYSKLASSPTKIAEYLAAGLPVITGAGIGDCDQMIAHNKVGVIVEDHSERGYRRAVEQIRSLIEAPEVRARCQGIAEQELSLSAVGCPRYFRVYQKLLGREVHDAPQTIDCRYDPMNQMP